MIRVAFCCHGNICRSTLSESVFTHKVNALGLGDQFIIDSFATSREEIGNHPHRGTVNKLREVGIPCLNVIYPVYADVNRGIESEFNGKGKQVFIGTAIAVYCFCEGAGRNQITLTA